MGACLIQMLFQLSQISVSLWWVQCGLLTWHMQRQLLSKEVARPLLAVAGLVEELQTLESRVEDVEMAALRLEAS